MNFLPFPLIIQLHTPRSKLGQEMNGIILILEMHILSVDQRKTCSCIYMNQ